MRIPLFILLSAVLTFGGGTYGTATAEGVSPKNSRQEKIPRKAQTGTAKEKVKTKEKHEKRSSNEKSRTAAFKNRWRKFHARAASQNVQNRLEENNGNQSQKTSGKSVPGASSQDLQRKVHRGSNHARSRSDRNYIGVFTITAYTAGPESTGKSPGDPEYGITATGTHVKEGRTIAADWDRLPPGTQVYIEGLGTYTVEDRGGAVDGNHLDVYMASLHQALAWGIKHRKVWIVKGDEN